MPAWQLEPSAPSTAGTPGVGHVWLLAKRRLYLRWPPTERGPARIRDDVGGSLKFEAKAVELITSSERVLVRNR